MSGGELDRRSFLVGASVTGGGLALGLPFLLSPPPTDRRAPRVMGSTLLAGWSLRPTTP